MGSLNKRETISVVGPKFCPESLSIVPKSREAADILIHSGDPKDLLHVDTIENTITWKRMTATEHVSAVEELLEGAGDSMALVMRECTLNCPSWDHLELCRFISYHANKSFNMFMGQRAMNRIIARMYTLAADILREYDQQDEDHALARAALWHNVKGRLGIILKKDVLTHIACKAAYGDNHDSVIFGWIPLTNKEQSSRAWHALEEYLAPIREDLRKNSLVEPTVFSSVAIDKMRASSGIRPVSARSGRRSSKHRKCGVKRKLKRRFRLPARVSTAERLRGSIARGRPARKRAAEDPTGSTPPRSAMRTSRS